MKKRFLVFIMASVGVNTCFGQIADFSGGPKNETIELTPKSEVDRPSKVQSKHLKEIVFSSSKIVKNNEDESSFIKEWNLGDPLFYRIYQENTIEQHAYKIYKKKKMNSFQGVNGASVLTVVKIDGKEVCYLDRIGTEKRIKNWVTSSGFIFQPDVSKGTGDLAVVFKDAYNKLGADLTNGKHTLEFECYAFPKESVTNANIENRTELLAKGSLIVNITPEGRAKYNIRSCNVFKDNDLEMENPELVQDIMKVFSANYQDKKAVYANITSNDWDIYRNRLGVILNREVHCFVIYESSNGKTFWREVRVEQQYDGTQYQKTLKLVATSADILKNDKPIAPECAAFYKENDKNFKE